MKHKHCCVVDADGAYKTFVLVLLEEGEDGKIVEIVQHYKMAEGEQLIDAKPPVMRPYAGAAGGSLSGQGHSGQGPRHDRDGVVCGGGLHPGLSGGQGSKKHARAHRWICLPIHGRPGGSTNPAVRQ